MKTKTKKVKQEANSQLSEMEKKLAQMNLENEQMKKVLKEREEQLAKLEKVKAMEKLANADLETEEEEEEFEIPELEDEIEAKPPIKPEDTLLSKNSEFERVLETFNKNNEGTIDIYRLRDGKEYKIGSIPVKEFGTTLDNIAKKYGGGEYMLYLRDRDGRFAKRTSVYYDEIAYPTPSNTTPMYPVINNQPDITTLVKNIQEQSEKSTDKMMAMMTAVMQSFGQMFAQKSALISSVRDVETIAELFEGRKKKEDSPLNNLETLLTIFEKGMEFGSQANKGEEPDNEFLGLVKTLLPSVLGKQDGSKLPLKDVINEIKLKSNKAPIPNPPQIEKKETIAQSNQVNEKKETTQMNLIQQLMIENYKKTIIELAKQNYDIEKTAKMVIARIPTDYLAWSYDFSKLPNVVDVSITYIPELAEYREWTEKVLTRCSAILEEIIKEETEAEEEESND